jgi:hypothetical protein
MQPEGSQKQLVNLILSQPNPLSTITHYIYGIYVSMCSYKLTVVLISRILSLLYSQIKSNFIRFWKIHHHIKYSLNLCQHCIEHKDLQNSFQTFLAWRMFNLIKGNMLPDLVIAITDMYKSYRCNRTFRPIALWYVETPTFSKLSAHRWRWGCQPYAPAALAPPPPQENFWYSFLSEAESTPGPQCDWKD